MAYPRGNSEEYGKALNDSGYDKKKTEEFIFSYNTE